MHDRSARQHASHLCPAGNGLSSGATYLLGREQWIRPRPRTSPPFRNTVIATALCHGITFKNEHQPPGVPSLCQSICFG